MSTTPTTIAAPAAPTLAPVVDEKERESKRQDDYANDPDTEVLSLTVTILDSKSSSSGSAMRNTSGVDSSDDDDDSDDDDESGSSEEKSDTDTATLLLKHFAAPEQLKDLQCSICRSLLRDPHLLSASSAKCGHHFCGACITRLVECKSSERKSKVKTIKCPVCREVIKVDRIQPDSSVSRKIAALVVSCPWSGGSGGYQCKWKDCLGLNNKNLISHLQSCPNGKWMCGQCHKWIKHSISIDEHKCPMAEIPCRVDARCRAMFLRKYERQHAECCEYRKIECEYCCTLFTPTTTTTSNTASSSSLTSMMLTHVSRLQQLRTSVESIASLTIEEIGKLGRLTLHDKKEHDHKHMDLHLLLIKQEKLTLEKRQCELKEEVGALENSLASQKKRHSESSILGKRKIESLKKDKKLQLAYRARWRINDWDALPPNRMQRCSNMKIKNSMQPPYTLYIQKTAATAASSRSEAGLEVWINCFRHDESFKTEEEYPPLPRSRDNGKVQTLYLALMSTKEDNLYFPIDLTKECWCNKFVITYAQLAKFIRRQPASSLTPTTAATASTTSTSSSNSGSTPVLTTPHTRSTARVVVGGSSNNSMSSSSSGSSSSSDDDEDEEDDDDDDTPSSDTTPDSISDDDSEEDVEGALSSTSSTSSSSSLRENIDKRFLDLYLLLGDGCTESRRYTKRRF